MSSLDDRLAALGAQSAPTAPPDPAVATIFCGSMTTDTVDVNRQPVPQVSLG